MELSYRIYCFSKGNSQFSIGSSPMALRAKLKRLQPVLFSFWSVSSSDRYLRRSPSYNQLDHLYWIMKTWAVSVFVWWVSIKRWKMSRKCNIANSQWRKSIIKECISILYSRLRLSGVYLHQLLSSVSIIRNLVIYAS